MRSYSDMGFRRPLVRRRKTNPGCFFPFALLFLVCGCIPALLNIPGLQARFTGNETTALVREEARCSRNGSLFSFTFTDQRGEEHHIKDTSTCSSGIFHDGQQVTLWYQPDNPSHFITTNDLIFDLIFVAAFSVPMLIWIVFCLVALFRWLGALTL